MSRTHTVTNQVPPLATGNAYAADAALHEAVTTFAGPDHHDELDRIGRRVREPSSQELGREANRDLPRLRTHDRFGHRVDEVDYSPAWHDLMRSAVAAGLHGAPWFSAASGAHVRRAAGFVLQTQIEPGHMCPISMTYAALPALRTDPALERQWAPALATASYDFGLRDPQLKTGLIAGMAMTEKQGGSDVRTNTTTAVQAADGTYRLTGHKWFCSAPMCDLFLVLAQTEPGPTCFVVPRVLPGGERNPFLIQRLKDKLGNRSNASSEIEFEGTTGFLLGEPGRGVPTIVEMVSATRLDCVLGATGLMRAATSHAVWHADHRSAFGSLLRDKPLMRNVLADLAVETEAATWLGVRLAAAVDAAEDGDEEARLLRRIALPASKYLTTKRAMAVTGEALECLGGNGYAEESGMPLLYREAPVNSVWEGSGNVNALDLLRALTRQPEVLDVLLSELGSASGTDARYDHALKSLLDELGDATDLEFRSRRLAERVAVLLQASLLLRHAPDAVADAFVATRVARDRGVQFGTLPRGLAIDEIIDRSRP